MMKFVTFKKLSQYKYILLVAILLVSGCASVQPEYIGQGVVQQEKNIQKVNKGFTHENASVMENSALIGAGGGFVTGGTAGWLASVPCAIFGPGGYLACASVMIPTGMAVGTGVGAGTGALVGGASS